MSQILYTRLSPRHNWQVLATKAENSGQFIRSWNSFLAGVCYREWLNFHPKTQIGLIESDFEGGYFEDKYDNLSPKTPVLEVWNVVDLVSPIGIK